MTKHEKRCTASSASSFGFRHSFVIRISSFDRLPRRWLLLLCTGLLALSGASCPQMLQQYTNPLPRVLPPSPTLEQVIEVVNRNNSQIQSFSTNRASLSGPGFPVAAGERGLRAAAAVPPAGGDRADRHGTRPGQQRRTVLVLDAAEPAAGHVLLPPRPVRRQPGAADDAFRAGVADRGVGRGGVRSGAAAPGAVRPCPTTGCGSTPSATRRTDR